MFVERGNTEFLQDTGDAHRDNCVKLGLQLDCHSLHVANTQNFLDNHVMLRFCNFSSRCQMTTFKHQSHCFVVLKAEF